MYMVPIQKKHVIDIERVQRRATKQLPCMKDFSYQDRLKASKLPTLVNNRTRADMVETYKLLHGKYYGEFSNMAKLQADHILREGTRGHCLKLFQDRANLNIRKECFPIRVVKVWNDLPEKLSLLRMWTHLKTGWTGIGRKRNSCTILKLPYQDST